jgi:hypothetical protein
MTDAELKALIAIFTTQTEDFVQAVAERMFGINEGTQALNIGANDVLFGIPYDEGEEWEFIKLHATAADGFNVAIKLSNITHLGFTATVTKASTLKYRTTFMRNWISDKIT